MVSQQKKKSFLIKQPHEVMIKEITDGMGNVKNPERPLDFFKRTTRDYEFNKALPNNGPSPHPNQFSPKLGFVLPKAPQMPAYLFQ